MHLNKPIKYHEKVFQSNTYPQTKGFSTNLWIFAFLIVLLINYLLWNTFFYHHYFLFHFLYLHTTIKTLRSVQDIRSKKLTTKDIMTLMGTMFLVMFHRTELKYHAWHLKNRNTTITILNLRLHRISNIIRPQNVMGAVL